MNILLFWKLAVMTEVLDNTSFPRAEFLVPARRVKLWRVTGLCCGSMLQDAARGNEDLYSNG
jgi:hypothetical protein